MSRQSSKLLGLSSPGASSSGTKPGVNGNGKREREFLDTAGSVWKKQPTQVQTPSHNNKPRQVLNPYDTRAGPGKRLNGSLNNISIRPPANKKPRLESDNTSYSTSRFFNGRNPSNPTRDSAVIAQRIANMHNPNSISNVAIPSSSIMREGKGKEPMSSRSLTTSSTGHQITHPFGDNNQPIIIADDQDEDVGMVLHRKSSMDELDILAQANSSMTLADDLRVSPPDNSHPFRQSSPIQARSFAQDGPSTLRLRKRFETQITEAPSTNNIGTGSRTASLMETVDSNRNDAEEIDSFTSPETDSKLAGKPRTSRRAKTPQGTTLFAAHNVLKKREMFEPKSKPKSQELDLKTLPLKKGLTSGMKPRAALPPLRIESKGQLQRSSRPMRNSPRKDRVATSSTTYTSSPEGFAIPLEVCIWGGDILKDDTVSMDPTYWAVWDPEMSELLITDRPVTLALRSERAVFRSIKFEHLRGQKLQVSDEREKPLIKIDFDDSHELDGDNDWQVALFGIALKFKPEHPNTLRYVPNLRSALMNMCKGASVHLSGPAIDSCLEMARRNTEQNADSSNPFEMDDVRDRPSASKKSTPPIWEKQPTIKPKTTFTAVEPTRRSTRLSLPKTCSPPATSSINPDEVILVYPPSGPGALNVTNGDLKRLDPSEFLNDTLIELGLKFLMNDIRETNPALADDVHVFSTFFYKKLNNKNFEEGYKSVRKWTAKVDLFKKKYIIVPINENIHWYLAIVYRPEYILSDAEPPKTAPRTLRRKSTVELKTYVPSATENEDRGAAKSEAANQLDFNGRSPTIQDDDDLDSDVDAVEQVIRSTGSCSLADEENLDKRLLSPDIDGFVPSAEFLGHVEGGGPQGTTDKSPTVSDSEGARTEDEEDQLVDDDEVYCAPPISHSPSHTPVPPVVARANIPQVPENDLMDVDSPTEIEESHMLAIGEAEGRRPTLIDPHIPIRAPSRAESFPSIPAREFYRSASEMGKQRDAMPAHETSLSPDPIDELLRHKETDPSDSEKEEETNSSDMPDERTTYVFTFDSLGSQHIKACKLLSQYIMAEARDKKGFSNPSEAKGKKALVPVQPNYCDCGLYLLHFAKMFLSDPDKFKALICSSKGGQQAAARTKAWQGDLVARMREDMAHRISRESEIYKTLKAEKENQKKEGEGGVTQATGAEDSDDEIIVGHITRKVPSPVKRGRKSNSTAKTQTETKATRLRG